MLIDVNNHCSNHVMNDSVVSFVIPLSHDASPPGVSIDIIKSSTRMLVTSIYFYKAPSSSTLTRLHGCCSFFNVVRTKRIIGTGYLLDTVVNIQSLIVFVHTTVIMVVNPQTEVTS